MDRRPFAGGLLSLITINPDPFPPLFSVLPGGKWDLELTLDPDPASNPVLPDDCTVAGATVRSGIISLSIVVNCGSHYNDSKIKKAKSY